MSYKEKPQIKLYKYENNAFSLVAIIDDYSECSWENNRFQAGVFSISINYNIPNALLFAEKLWVQFGNNPYSFGEINKITDRIGADGKGSQIRTITGYDARYIFKRRIIKSLNSENTWSMIAKGEICMRSLIADQCGASAEAKRRLPVVNTIPAVNDAIGSVYSVSESFTNLYEVLRTIATQTEIGWRIRFDGELTLEFYEGEDRRATVRFDTNYDSLQNGEFTDSLESYANSILISGKGTGSDRDLYEGETGTPQGLDRFEAYSNQSEMTTEEEYEAQAQSMLSQYGQTLTVSGNGLAKCPYIYGEQYDVGDIITISFSGKSAVVQILSVTEHWRHGAYDITFSFGKPQNTLSEQLQIILRKIQQASNKTTATSSVKWYTIPTDTAMSASDVTYDTIGFTGDCGSGATFTLYLDDESTGAKEYNVYFKNLSGGKITLTTGKTGAENAVMNSGTYVARVYVDPQGNITVQSATATSVIASGNSQPVTSDGVAGAISAEEYARNMAIANAVNGKLDKTIPEISVSEVDNLSDTDIIICKIRDYPIGWDSNDGIIVHIPWSNFYAYQIALDDQSNWCAVRSKSNGQWNSWERIFSGRKTEALQLNSYSMNSGYSCTSLYIEDTNFYCSGLYVFQLHIENIAGGSIGSTATNVIAKLNMSVYPIQNICAIGFDYFTGNALRLMITPQGDLSIKESIGVQSGYNQIRAVFIIA